MFREQRFSEVMLGLADTLVDDFEPGVLLGQLADATRELFPIDLAGILLADANGVLELAVTAPDDAESRALLGDAIADGPAAFCLATGEPSSDVALADVRERWPAFVEPALAAGFFVTHLFPLRLRGVVIGVVHLLAVEGPALTQADREAAEALADMATIGLVRDRAAEKQASRARDLQSELDDQIVIEQARGILRERTGESPEAILRLMSARAAVDQVDLRDIARGIVDGTVVFDD